MPASHSWFIPCFVISLVLANADALKAQSSYEFPQDAIEAWNQVASIMERKGWEFKRRIIQTNHMEEKKSTDIELSEKCSGSMRVLSSLAHKWRGRKQGSCQVGCANDEYVFGLKRPSESGAWVLDELYRYEDDTENETTLRERLVGTAKPDLDALFYWVNWPFSLREVTSAVIYQFIFHQVNA